MAVIVGQSLFGGGDVVLRDGGSNCLQARPGEVEPGKELVVRQRSGAGER
jgi:hypothetical protein